MESRIPIPTDNIYKFYALFGLLLMVFSIGAVIYVANASNDVVLNSVVELEGLRQETNPTNLQKVRRQALERRLEITLADRKFYQYGLAFITVVGVFGMYYGFKKWHQEIQPAMDEAARVQLETSKLQLEKLKIEVDQVKSASGAQLIEPPSDLVKAVA